MVPKQYDAEDKRLRESSRLFLFPLGAQNVVLCIPVLFIGFAMVWWETDLANLIFKSISDAYLQVSTFVAATFLIFYSCEKFFNIDAARALRNAAFWQVPIAAGLGALPGCGGAIIVVTQYVTGRLSFGSVVAVLTATMGDAAFLLIAQAPLTGISMMIMGLVVGSLSGWVVNIIHHKDFLFKETIIEVAANGSRQDASSPFLDLIWYLLLAPGVILAILVAFQVDVDTMFATTLFDKPATLLGVIGGTLAVVMQLAPRVGLRGDVGFSRNGTILRRTVKETNFVTLWVILAYLVFELSIYFLAIDLKLIFEGWAVLTPLISVLIGFLPGCGPQVLITTMYLAGFIPLSAQIGNAISNDGDALFPALAIAPRVALIATLYSGIPALIVSYGWFFVME
tara:strand:- start:123 stop:1313 length:1191 start_codon:yes stop_codon:yes gene_type:complete